MKIRFFNKSDTPALLSLFRNTVRTINIRDYSREQTLAWAPDLIEEGAWSKRFSTSFTFVAIADEKIIGFSNLESNGHVDMFYVHAEWQGRGVGNLLYAAIETRAQELNLSRLFVEASITARPFFQRKGFKTDKEQLVITRGVEFTNFAMSKVL